MAHHDSSRIDASIDAEADRLQRRSRIAAGMDLEHRTGASLGDTGGFEAAQFQRVMGPTKTNLTDESGSNSRVADADLDISLDFPGQLSYGTIGEIRGQ